MAHLLHGGHHAAHDLAATGSGLAYNSGRFATAAGVLLAAAPAYLKSHSQGEYVFDHGWADAFHRAGGRYYPKLLGAVPFTPATGPRFLNHPDGDTATVREALMQLQARGFVEVRSRRGWYVVEPSVEDARDAFSARRIHTDAPVVLIGAPALTVSNLSRSDKVCDVSFEVRSGEIFGISGLIGAGRTELLRLIFGADVADSGSIALGTPARPVSIRSPVDAVANGVNVQAYLKSSSYDLLILDVMMPGMDGLEVLEKLQAHNPDLPVVMISGHGTIETAVTAIREGAYDFIEKPFEESVIIEAVRRAAERLADSSAGTLSVDDIRSRIGSLSERERQILAAVVAGQPNKAIAFNLDISPRTVEVHRANVMTKMRARSLPELVRMSLTVSI